MIRRARQFHTVHDLHTGRNLFEDMNRHAGTDHHKARGMVLLLGLGLLAGLSLLGLLAANSMLQQRQMAANHADAELARLSAMTAVSSGERFVLGLPAAARTEHCATHCFAEPTDSLIHGPGSLPVNAELLPDGWWSDKGITAQSALLAEGQDANPAWEWSLPGRYPPQFLLEELKYVEATEPANAESAPVVAGIGYYRVLGRGTGVAPNSTRVVESILARPWHRPDEVTASGEIQCSTYRPWYDCGRMAYRERR
jgi:Tfp pilus assembly protein PilX